MNEFEQRTSRMTVEESLGETKVKNMTTEDAIRAIQSNYPASSYTALCEALDMAIAALHEQHLAEQAAAVPEGTQKIEVTREMIVKIKMVTKPSPIKRQRNSLRTTCRKNGE